MAIAHVKDTEVSYTATATTHQCAMTSTTGNALFLVILQTNNAPQTPSRLTGVTDSAGNTWTLVTGDGTTDANFGGRVDGAFCLNATAVTSVTVQTLSFISGVGQAVVVSEFSGLSPVTALDGSAAAHYGNATSPLTISVTTAYPGDVVIAAACAAGGWASISYTSATTGAQPKSVGYNIAAAPGSQSCTFTTELSGSVFGSLIFAVGAPPPPQDYPALQPGPSWLRLYKPQLPRPLPPVVPSGPNPANLPSTADSLVIAPGPSWLAQFKRAMPKPPPPGVLLGNPPRQYFLSLGSAISASGAIASQPQTAYQATAVATAGTLARAARTRLITAVLAAPVVSAALARPLTTAVTVAAALSRRVGKPLATIIVTVFAPSGSVGAGSDIPGFMVPGGATPGFMIPGGVSAAGVPTAIRLLIFRSLPAAVITSAAVARTFVSSLRAAAVTTACTLTSQAAKALNVTGATVGALSAALSRTLTVSAVATGALTAQKVTAKLFTVTAATAGALTRSLSRALATAVATSLTAPDSTPGNAVPGFAVPGGDTGPLATRIQLAVLRTLPAAVTALASLARRLSRSLPATVGTAPVLHIITVALRTFAATTAVASVITRQAAKALAAPVVTAGAVARRCATSLRGAAATAGALARAAARGFASAAATAAALTRAASRTLLATAAVTTGSLARAPRATARATVATAGTITRLAGKRLVGQAVVVTTGALRLTYARILAGAAVVTAAVERLLVAEPFRTAVSALAALVPLPIKHLAATVATSGVAAFALVARKLTVILGRPFSTWKAGQPRRPD